MTPIKSGFIVVGVRDRACSARHFSFVPTKTEVRAVLSRTVNHVFNDCKRVIYEIYPLTQCWYISCSGCDAFFHRWWMGGSVCISSDIISLSWYNTCFVDSEWTISLLALLLLPRMLDTANRFHTIPQLLVVSSEVHYWTSFEDKVFESPNAFQLLNSKEYCTPR